MARGYGNVGLSYQKVVKGIAKEVETVVPYRYVVQQYSYRYQTVESSTSKDLALNMQVTIVSDEFLRDNLASIKWVEVSGVKWSVTSAVISYPNITLTLGSVYTK